MKRLFYLFVSVLTLGIASSCSSSDDGDDNGGGDALGITGKWYFYQQGTMVGGQEQLSIYAHSNCGKDYVNLKNNGVFEEMYYSEVGGGCNEEFDNSGHWEVDADGDEFTVSYDDEVWLHGDILIFNETTLKIVATENGQNTILVFKRSLNNGGGNGGGDVSAFAGQWDGTYTGDDSGIFSVTISNNGQINGNGYSTNWGESFSLSGTVNSNGSFNAGNSSTGATFTGTIIGNNLTGNWNNPMAGESGTFVGQKQ